MWLMAKPGGVPPQTTALDANLRADLDRADLLLESFLTLAHAQHGRDSSSSLSPVRLDRLLADALAARRGRIAEQRIEVRTALDPVSVTGSETLLARMVENVIENAVLHNQPGGLHQPCLRGRARRGATGGSRAAGWGPGRAGGGAARSTVPAGRARTHTAQKNRLWPWPVDRRRCGRGAWRRAGAACSPGGRPRVEISFPAANLARLDTVSV